MIVVSDTTPLISLLKINRLDLLQKLFGAVVVPCAVFKELSAGGDFECVSVKKCGFVKIEKVDSDEVFAFQRHTGLDLGESEALILARKMNADIVLIDEAKARQTAAQLGLRIMGSVGILKVALDEGLVSSGEIKADVKTLRNSRRFISQKLYDWLLKSVDEKQ